MKNKKIRHHAISEIINTSTIRNQDDLLQLLLVKGFSLTQATLSRDLKLMKVAKQPTEKGEYSYTLPLDLRSSLQVFQTQKDADRSFAEKGFLSIDFSGNMAVIKTRPGYAGGIASDIDAKALSQFLGSIAGDDTILLIIREGVSKETVIDMLTSIIPGIRA